MVEREDVKLLDELLTEKNKDTGYETPIHVGAASGGFTAPFLYPDLEWDFCLPLVKSINVSGHKYGLVYPELDGLCGVKMTCQKIMSFISITVDLINLLLPSTFQKVIDL